MNKKIIFMVFLLALSFSHTAKAFYLDNSTLLQPTPLSMTFQIADWYNITESLTIDVNGIRLNDYWLESAPNETTNLTVHNFSELYREFMIFNTSDTPYIEFNMSGLNKSTATEIYADFVLVDNVSTNSSGWLNYVFRAENLSSLNTTVIINQTLNNTYIAPPTVPAPEPSGSLLSIIRGGRNITVPNCSFELYPSKLIGTGRPQGPINPDFTLYIKNLYINQSFSPSFDWTAGIQCYIDYSYNTNFGKLLPDEITSYRIGCLTPMTNKTSTVTVSSSGGCVETIEMELLPTADAGTELDVAFLKMSFGDMEGFLNSEIGGVTVMMWIIIILIFILLLILILATVVLGGK